ncbi:MAG: hypothetical protein H6727_02310 [Myxococcales bacterium]|nr:hypothetical protein [Myxococcales bacterium]
MTLLLLCAGTSAFAHTDLYIPLTLQEALPNDPKSATFQLLKGQDRLDEPVTFTIPIDADAEISSFVLIGAKYAQITPLVTWPNGRPRWLKIHTQVDLRGSEQYQKMFLTAGEGNLTGPDLATDSADKITISTGAASFTLPKKTFRGFEQVQVGDLALLQQDPSAGIFAEDADGKVYSAALDPNIKVSVEENGPVRAVILVKGNLQSQDQKILASFTMRLAFTRAKPDVRITFSLQNASKERPQHLRLRSLSITLATKLSAAQTTFATHDTPFTKSLQANDAPLTLFQGQNTLPTQGLELYPTPPTKLEGYTIQQGQQSLGTGTKEQAIPLFVAQLTSATADQGCITFGTRFAAQYAPQSLQTTATGNITLSPFPAQENQIYTLRFGSHHTSEHYLHFSKKKVDEQSTFFLYQYPLVIKPKVPEWHNESHSFGIDRMISFKEEETYFDTQGWKTTGDPLAVADRRPHFSPIRALRWDPNQPLLHDPARIAMSNFFRQEADFGGTYYLQARQRIAYYADQSVFHSDDFDAATRCQQTPTACKDNAPLPDAALPNAQGIPDWNPRFPAQDRHAYGLAQWYMITGDPRIRDAFLDWGENLLDEIKRESNDNIRSYAWKLIALSTLYTISKEARYQEAAWSLLQKESLQKTAKPGTSSGTDWQRGFFVPPSMSQETPRTLETEDTSELLLRAYATFLNEAAKDETQIDQTTSLIEGIARFTTHELWRQNKETPASSGYPKQYALDDAPPTDPTTLPDWQDGLRAGYLGFFYTYLFSRDTAWLDQAKRLQEATANNKAQRADIPDLPSRQSLHHMQEATILYAAWRAIPLRVDQTTDGTYILRWLAPPAAKSYQFKYAETPIVDWLDYDPQTKTFGKDPTQHTAFFAAKDLPNEPAPAERDALQEMRLDSLPKGSKFFFAARYTSTDPRGPTPLDAEANLEALKEAAKEVSAEPTADAQASDQPVTTGCHCNAPSAPESLLWLLFLGILLKRKRVPKRLSI